MESTNIAALVESEYYAEKLRGTRRRLRTLHDAVGLLEPEEIWQITRDLLREGSVTRSERVGYITITPDLSGFEGLLSPFTAKPEHDEKTCPLCQAGERLAARHAAPTPAPTKPVRRSNFVPPVEVAEQYALFGPINLESFLLGKGVKGYRLAKLNVEFGREVAKAYVEAHGEFPAKVPQRINGGSTTLVNWYEGSDDLALIERVYAEKMTAIELEVFGPVTD